MAADDGKITMSEIILEPGKLTLSVLKKIRQGTEKIQLCSATKAKIIASRQTVLDILAKGETVYGVNTGFGSFENKKISLAQCEQLQKNFLYAHAAGVGKLLSKEVTRLVLALKINALAQGYSGVRLELIETLIHLYNNDLLPCIPSKGSVGASGDLAPLTHMSLVLIGEGTVHDQGDMISGQAALAKIGSKPLTLAAKESLALANGTQVSTALALENCCSIETCLQTAIVAGALCVDACKGSDAPFDARIHRVRGQKGEIIVAKVLRKLLAGSEILASHQNCDKVQDPYSLRCQPQVLGACLDTISHVKTIILRECNAVTDNPLVFSEDNVVLSGGNFHAEPIAIAADMLALAIAEIGNLSERQTALMMDTHKTGLPAFLAHEEGLCSGYMIAHVTSASLASENKSLAHPASVDTIPTSANQEDHVSMATFAARRLTAMVDNTITILAINILAACQAVNLHQPLTTSKKLQAIWQIVREKIPDYKDQRPIAGDIEIVKAMIQEGVFGGIHLI